MKNTLKNLPGNLGKSCNEVTQRKHMFSTKSQTTHHDPEGDASAKSMSRSVRLQHTARLKNARRHYHRMDQEATARQVGRAFQAPAKCSCWLCGNQRKFNGELSIQEQRQLQTFNEYIDEVGKDQSQSSVL